MSIDSVCALVLDALWVALAVCGPILALTTTIGLGVSVLQAVTQINDSSIAFVAKMSASIVFIVVSGSWMLTTLVSFITRTIEGGLR